MSTLGDRWCNHASDADELPTRVETKRQKAINSVVFTMADERIPEGELLAIVDAAKRVASRFGGGA